MDPSVNTQKAYEQWTHFPIATHSMCTYSWRWPTVVRTSRFSNPFTNPAFVVDRLLFYHPPHLYAESFHRHPLEIDLTQACVGELNTILRGNINWPILYGIAVNITSGEIYPAAFSDKGPEQPLRQARNFTGGQQVRAAAAQFSSASYVLFLWLLEKWNLIRLWIFRVVCSSRY